MSAVRHYTLEELQQKQEKASQRQAWLAESAKRAAARERTLKKKIAQQEEEEKNHRLLARGALLEGIIENAPQLTDGQLEEILTIALRQDAVKKAIARMRPAAPAEPAPTLTGKEEKPDE